MVQCSVTNGDRGVETDIAGARARKYPPRRVSRGTTGRSSSHEFQEKGSGEEKQFASNTAGRQDRTRGDHGGIKRL